MSQPIPHQFADDGINPDSVPYKTTSTGARMPAIGLGTFGSDHYSGESIAEAVEGAIEVGYRHIDCAAVYGNERLLDLYLIHWPFPNYHAPGVEVTSRDPHARPYIHENFMKTWRQLEKLVDMGLVRHIGTSNMTIPKLRLLLRDTRIQPTANEMELHPHF